MKILLREFANKPYVWKTAKYNENGFVVDDQRIHEYQVVSVINDNRKNYVKCSSCGKIFPKKGNKFAKHKNVSPTIDPCLNCRNLRSDELSEASVKYVINDDGTYTKRTERNVSLRCHYSLWTDFPCNSTEAIRTCKLRQCEHANGEEIHDTFTDLPGLFDDIITVDTLFDNGYETIYWSDEYITQYVIDKDIGLYAQVNNLGIVDRFYLDNYNDCVYIWYSKKYDEFFWVEDYNYLVWCTNDSPDSDENKAKEYIRKIYK